jgi:hypothetical protein
MKALVLNAIGRGFDFEDVDIATPIGHEVLVDVEASELCVTLTCSSPLTISFRRRRCLVTRSPGSSLQSAPT